jgi:hypothetical protein
MAASASASLPFINLSSFIFAKIFFRFGLRNLLLAVNCYYRIGANHCAVSATSAITINLYQVVITLIVYLGAKCNYFLGAGRYTNSAAFAALNVYDNIASLCHGVFFLMR